MDIKEQLFVRAQVLARDGRDHDADLMIKASRAIEMLEGGFCPYCGNPLPNGEGKQK